MAETPYRTSEQFQWGRSEVEAFYERIPSELDDTLLYVGLMGRVLDKLHARHAEQKWEIHIGQDLVPLLLGDVMKSKVAPMRLTDQDMELALHRVQQALPIGVDTGLLHESALWGRFIEEATVALMPAAERAYAGLPPYVPAFLEAVDRDFAQKYGTEPLTDIRSNRIYYGLVMYLMKGFWCVKLSPKDADASMYKLQEQFRRLGKELLAYPDAVGNFDVLLDAQVWAHPMPIIRAAQLLRTIDREPSPPLES